MKKMSLEEYKEYCISKLEFESNLECSFWYIFGATMMFDLLIKDIIELKKKLQRRDSVDYLTANLSDDYHLTIAKVKSECIKCGDKATLDRNGECYPCFAKRTGR